MPALPNFFVAGAPKAGTTSLCNYLGQHPDVFMSPIKEPNYFALEVRPRNFEPRYRERIQRRVDELHVRLANREPGELPSGITVEWQDYLCLFRGAGARQAIGEGSVSYLWSPTAPSRIVERLRRPKVIAVLRDPAERAFSQYLQDLGNGEIRWSFSRHLEAAFRERERQLGPLYPFLEYGLYDQQVSRWIAAVGAENMHVIWYEDFRDRPAEVLAGVFAFLGVREFAPDMSKRYYESWVPRATGAAALAKRSGIWKALRRAAPAGVVSLVRRHAYRERSSITLKASDRTRLVEYYRPHVLNLSALMQRDLTS